jgi:DNA-binding protein HU-beta
VNKSDLVERVALVADISKASAGRAVDAALAAVKDALNEGGSVTLVGFGTFYVSDRAERSARNPRTGEEITVAAAKTPRFRAGKALKDALN